MEGVFMQEQRVTESTRPGKKRSPEFFTSALRICGVVDLIGSILFGLDSILASFTRFGNYYSFWLGVGLIFQGFVAYVIFNVFALMLENLMAIRKQLSSEGSRPVIKVAADNNAI
jgi:hypothetical protein